jgi:hypothetical protein
MRDFRKRLRLAEQESARRTTARQLGGLFVNVPGEEPGVYFIMDADGNLIRIDQLPSNWCGSVLAGVDPRLILFRQPS